MIAGSAKDALFASVVVGLVLLAGAALGAALLLIVQALRGGGCW